MHIFITGGSGWVGRHLLPLLVFAGHTISALSRSESSDVIIKALVPSGSLTIVRGDLTTLDILTTSARTVDAVIHLAFIHDFASPTHDFAANIATDGAAVKALAAGLTAGKIMINTSGTLGGARNGQPYLESEAGSVFRPDYSAHLASLGLVPIIVRLAPMVHGPGDKGFALALVAAALRTGTSAYIGDGQTRWAAVHIQDAARLYALALEKGQAGTYHAAETEGHSIKDIAMAIGARLDIPVQSISREDAATQWSPFMAQILVADSPVSTSFTAERTGWKPQKPDLLEDLRTSETYFDQASKNTVI